MLQSPDVVRESLNDLLNTLDATDDPSGSGGGTNRRLRLRRSFRTVCQVSCFPSGGPMMTLQAQTRNISFQGIAVVLPVELLAGHPIEVAIDLPDLGLTHLGGLVVFCRSVGRGHYEVGVEIRTSFCGAIFCNDPASAAAEHPWFAAAHAAVVSQCSP